MHTFNRKLLKTLTDTEYNNVLAVLSSYLHLVVTIEVKGILIIW